ncbi:hypothetical protein [Amycolatopsis sp. cg13]|uniref:hypothetical protein n=1 Tax=Amycolatopsis sp. cg13 TaxID=3238807 RepID=UPI00352537C0
MKAIQAIYRFAPNEEAPWGAYSYPQAVYTSGRSLSEVREKFTEAALFHYDNEQLIIEEHLELPLTDGVFVRIAQDLEEKHRRMVYDALARGLSYGDQADDLRRSSHAATGDVVVVACVADDELQWIFDQLDDADTLVVACEVSTFGVWSAPVIGPASDGAGSRGEPLLGNGLKRSSTVGDLMKVHDLAAGPLLV